MATYRIGIGSFSLAENGGVGVGTDATGQGNLKVKGVLQSTDLDIPGVSTFTRYGGFSAESGEFSHEKTLTGEYNTSGDIVVGLGNTLTLSGIGSTLTVGTVESVSIGTHFSPPTAGTEDRPEAPVEGTVRYNTDLGTLEFYNGVDWRQFTVNGASGRGVFGGGADPADTARIDYLNLSSGGDTQNFGDLTDARTQLGGVSSSIRGIFAGGDPGPSNSDVIEYITIASAGNGIDFGNLLTAGRLPAAASSSIRAIFAGENASNVISFVEINTTGNAVDFGDLTNTDGNKGTATSSPTKFVYASGAQSTIDSGTISSKGNTVAFGELGYGGDLQKPRATSNGIRGIFTGGYLNSSPYPGMKDICYIMMASGGNAADFGDLIKTRESAICTSSQIKSIHAGGNSDASGSGDLLSSIEAIDYASRGNGIEFGNLLGSNANGAGLSDCHGGLGGF